MGTRPLLLFDGVCNLCHASVGWVIAHDKELVFDFASLQSDYARKTLDGRLGNGEWPDSVVLVDEGGLHLRSDAVIGVGRRLGLPWSLVVVFKLLPRPLRDALYAGLASRRYAWFGKRERCASPPELERSRFLDGD